MDNTACVYNIFEFACLDEVFIPVRNTARVKYTCFDVSKKFLFIGANSGSLYVFLRNPLQYLRVLSNKEGPLIFVCIASHEHYVAFATSKGIVVILEHNINNVARVGRSGTPTIPPRYLHVSREHQGAAISALKWNDSGTILFIADDSGKITSVTVNIPSKKTKTLFQESTSMIAQLDSKIVQMDFANYKLLISTLKNFYLCDTLKEQYSLIGSKPRAGEFGVCFYNKLANQMPFIYAARPGSRLWEVDYEGSVLCTHQFKQALSTEPVPIVSVREQFFSEKSTACPVPNSINFPRLLIVGGKHFLLTWVKDLILVIDPGSMSVLLWTRFSNDIQDIKVYVKKLYVWFIDGKFRMFQLLTVDRGISKLLSHSCWKLGALVCNFYKATVTSSSSRKLIPKHLLENLITHLSQNDEKELKKSMEDLVAGLEESPADLENVRAKGRQDNYQVESGIYVVNRPRSDAKHLSSGRDLSSSGSSPTMSRETGSVNNVTVEKCKGSATGNPLRGSKSQNQFMPKRNENFVNSPSDMTESNSKAIKKSSSGMDLKHYKGGKQGLYRGSSLDNFYHGYPMVPMPVTFIGATLWDGDPTYAYSSLAALNPSAALDGLRNSLTSKYKSGKESILGKIGILEDHLKSIAIEDPPELLDVPNGNSKSYSDFHNSYEETLCTNGSPILKVDLTALLNLTKETLTDNLDSSGISSISLPNQILEEWVNVLLSTQELMHCTLYRQRNIAEAKVTKIGIANELDQSKSSISVPVDTFVQYPLKLHCDIQLSNPDNDLRRKSWPITGCDNKCSNSGQESKETQLTIGSEPQNIIYKSCPKELGTLKISDQCSDQLPNRAVSSLQLEDFLWWYDMKLLDENPLMQLKDVKEGHCFNCHPTIFTSDPWGLGLDEHKLVSRLAAVCFKTKTFDRIWKYCTEFACFKSISNLGQSSAAKNPLKFAADAIGMDNEGLVLDHARAIFVMQFFHLLDTKEIFRELHHDIGSTFQTWSTIISGFMKNVAKGSSEYKSLAPLLSAISCQPKDFPLIINTLISEPDSFSARDVLYVEQLRHHSSRNIFLEYMDAIHEGRSTPTSIPRGFVKKSHKTFQEMCTDPLVHVSWLSYLLQDGQQSLSMPINCVCGKPRPWAHLVQWKRADLMLQIVRMNPVNQKACLQLCEQFGFWLGYLYLCHGLGMRQEGMKILVQLSDINLFGDHFNISLLPETIDEWRTVLQLIAQKETKKNCCIFCKAILTDCCGGENIPKKNIISFENVARFLFKLSGAKTTLQLFKDVMEVFPDIKLSTSFYWQCIASAISKQQERKTSMRGSMPMNADVLLSQKNYASPQIRSHLLKEMHKLHHHKAEPPAINRCPFREDFPCHWGINIDLTSLCNACSLPLAIPLASAHEGGIRLFPCGHGFHLQCITSKTCPKC